MVSSFKKIAASLKNIQFSKFLENLKIIVEVLAIIIGGYWTYYKFIYTEEYMLHSSYSLTTSLNWKPINSNNTAGIFNVQLKNTGTTTFTLDGFEIRIYIMKQPNYTSDITFFDPSQIMKSPYTLLCKKVKQGESLIEDYIPQLMNEDDFVAVFNNSKFSEDKVGKQIILFQFIGKLTSKKNQKETLVISDYRYTPFNIPEYSSSQGK